MLYRARLNRKVRNIKVYTLLKSSGERQNAVTKLFMRIFAKKNTEQGGAKG
jgi:hypothetical protein